MTKQATEQVTEQVTERGVSAHASKLGGAGHVLTFRAETAALADLGAFLRSACGEHPQVALTELAVTEVVVNAVKHGGATWCRVEVSKAADSLTVLVGDDGKPFDVTSAAASPPGELRESGYGVGIIQRAAQLSYAYRDGWNLLTLTFSR